MLYNTYIWDPIRIINTNSVYNKNKAKESHTLDHTETALGRV